MICDELVQDIGSIIPLPSFVPQDHQLDDHCSSPIGHDQLGERQRGSNVEETMKRLVIQRLKAEQSADIVEEFIELLCTDITSTVSSSVNTAAVARGVAAAAGCSFAMATGSSTTDTAAGARVVIAAGCSCTTARQ